MSLEGPGRAGAEAPGTTHCLEARPLSMRILLVDDSPVNRRVAGLMLERAGHRVVPADRGRHALRLLDEAEFDVVLMDVEMPDMDGPETTTLLRRQGHTAVPVVALTAHTEAAQRERCLRAGMNAVLNKPFRIKDLVAAVERWGSWPPEPEEPI